MDNRIRFSKRHKMALQRAIDSVSTLNPPTNRFFTRGDESASTDEH